MGIYFTSYNKKEKEYQYVVKHIHMHSAKKMAVIISVDLH